MTRVGGRTNNNGIRLDVETESSCLLRWTHFNAMSLKQPEKYHTTRNKKDRSHKMGDVIQENITSESVKDNGR